MSDTIVMSIDHIVKTSTVRGGAARIDGTSITVHALIAQLQDGATVEELLEGYAHIPLTRAQIYAALAYYYDHQSEVDARLAEEAELLAQIKHETQAILTSDEEYVTAREAAQMMDLSPRSYQVASLCREGKLDCKKVANRWFVSIKSIEDYITQDRKPGPKG